MNYLKKQNHSIYNSQKYIETINKLSSIQESLEELILDNLIKSESLMNYTMNNFLLNLIKIIENYYNLEGYYLLNSNIENNYEC